MAQLAIVEDLAIVGDDVATVRRDHRLVAARREVDDGQAAMTEGNPSGRIKPNALAIRTAMGEAVSHSDSLRTKFLGRRLCEAIDYAGNAAHRVIKSRVARMVAFLAARATRVQR